MARAANFDLAGALASPSFTPAQRDAPALVELVVAGEEPAAQRAATAVAKLGEAGRKAVEARLGGGGPVGGDTSELGDASTARLMGALGQLARGGDQAARTALIERTRDPHVRVRRAAISALGKIGGDAAREALLARWDENDVPPDERRTLVEALGKIGGEGVLAKLQALDTDDAEAARRRDRALLIIERTSTRAIESTIDIEKPLPRAVDVILHCKRGLGTLLVEDLQKHGFSPAPLGDSAVRLRLAGAWQALYASRLWSSAAIAIPLGDGTDLGDRIVAGLQPPHVRATLEAMTRGPIRYRLQFASGKRRSLVWSLAKRLPFVNDPTDTTWELFIDEEHATIELTPRKAVDPRFAWRVTEVPAASHPTVAAALAYVAGAKPTDRVWDPFVGSGAELVERARLGPYASLIGSDLDEEALAAARSNFDAAGLTARLERGDARTHDAGTVDLIITNPPLGSRVQLDAKGLLVAAIPHFARTLANGGRLVWITPATKHTTPIAERAGLRRTRSLSVDLGGVRGQLERWDK